MLSSIPETQNSDSQAQETALFGCASIITVSTVISGNAGVVVKRRVLTG